MNYLKILIVLFVLLCYGCASDATTWKGCSDCENNATTWKGCTNCENNDTTWHDCFGCIADVKPWQKGNLAKPHMAVEPDALLRAIREQIVTSKESASGGYSVVGGGCGCN